MRFASLGSGSKGNAWLVEKAATRVLIDCGFGVRDMAGRLARLGIEPKDISAILITHEHSDHGRGAARFSAKHACPVCWSQETATMVKVYKIDHRIEFDKAGGTDINKAGGIRK